MTITKFYIIFLLFLPFFALAQVYTPPRLLSLEWADTLHKPSARAAVAGAVIAYPLAMTGLWQAWYADYALQGNFIH